jgi:hypothetical protein
MIKIVVAVNLTPQPQYQTATKPTKSNNQDYYQLVIVIIDYYGITPHLFWRMINNEGYKPGMRVVWGAKQESKINITPLGALS